MTFRQTCCDFFARLQSLLSSPLPPSWSVNRFWFALQVAFAVWLIYLSAHPPAPGMSIGVLGLLAVVATFEHEPSRLQRSFWIVISTGLLIVELNAIAHDRLENQGEQATVRAVDQTRFLIMAKSLQTAITEEESQTKQEQTQFKATVTHFQDVLNTETGGSSFCYLSFKNPYYRPYFDVKAIRVGKYPLKGVSAVIGDDAKFYKLLESRSRNPQPRTPEEGPLLIDPILAASRTTLHIGDFATDFKDLGPYPLTTPTLGLQQFDILLNANNGDWREEIAMVSEEGPYPDVPHSGVHHWSQAIIVESGSKILLMEIDSDYPRAPNGDPLYISVPSHK